MVFGLVPEKKSHKGSFYILIQKELYCPTSLKRKDGYFTYPKIVKYLKTRKGDNCIKHNLCSMKEG